MNEITDSSAATEEFDARVDHLLQTTCAVARALVVAHQAAMAMIVAGDWARARKYFSSWGPRRAHRRRRRAQLRFLQVSDRVEGGDFDAEDERRLACLANGAAVGLDALRKVRALRLGEPAPPSPVEPAASFMVIEPA